MERRAPNHGRKLSADCAHELLNGKISYSFTDYAGYGDGVGTDAGDFVSDEMRADWLANRELLIKVWKSGKLFPHDVWPGWRIWLSVDHNGEPLPWCERQFGGSSSPRK